MGDPAKHFDYDRFFFFMIQLVDLNELPNRTCIFTGAAYGRGIVAPFVVAIARGESVRSIRVETHIDGGGNIEFASTATVWTFHIEAVVEAVAHGCTMRFWCKAIVAL